MLLDILLVSLAMGAFPLVLGGCIARYFIPAVKEHKLPGLIVFFSVSNWDRDRGVSDNAG